MRTAKQNKQFMSKETVIAIIIGALFGLSIALLVLLKIPLQSILQKNQPQVKVNESDTKKQQKNNAMALEITEPEDRAKSDSSKLQIKGNSNKQALIVIFSTADQKTTNADDNGKFQAEINLIEGPNNIQITSYSNKEQPQIKELKIYYYDKNN